MSFNDLKKAIKEYIFGKNGSKLSAKQQQQIVVEFEDYCHRILNGEVRYFNPGNVVGEFEWLENYAKNEPDNKTQFKLYNVEQSTQHLIGRTFMSEDFDTMLERIRSKCGNNPANETTHVGRFLAAYNQYAIQYKKVASKGLSPEYLQSIEAANQTVEDAYTAGIAQIGTVYDNAKTAVVGYTIRHEKQVAETAKITEFQNSKK